ncbi:hypothetical protein VTO42DRAFT_2816 [Malbranchea cinnamomea]
MSKEEDTAQHEPQAAQSTSSWFPALPAPVKRVFDSFPLVTYPPNALPSRSHRQSGEHVLYVFTDARGARRGVPSFNPQCLKWQAYLRFSGIEFRTASSSNHASPNGSLPYLLPADSILPVASSKLHKWVKTQLQNSLSEDGEQGKGPRYEPYMSLLDHRIRNAWLYTLYLHEPNFTSVARRLYVEPTTTNPLVRRALAYELQQAARTELLKGSSSSTSISSPSSSFYSTSSGYIDVDDILAEANSAFEALSTLLGDDEFFFGAPQPGVFDASVFAYTHLILDEGMGWKQNFLGRYLRRYENLVQHRDRLHEEYFSNS